MRTHTSGFKKQIKELGREIDSRITYGSNVISAENLFSVTPILNADILKSVMKQLDFESSIQVPVNTVIKYEFGLKVNGGYEYLDYGNYIVYSSEYNEDTQTYEHTCYDSMLFSMKEYTNLQNGTFPMTVCEYITNLCLDCGLVFKNANDIFANYNKTIDSDLYANLGYTYRDIFDELSQVTASVICIDSNNQVEVRYISETNDVIDEEYMKNINVKFGKKYGPINSIVLSRSGESDNVYLQDEDSISTNGLCELKIIDNQIMNFNNRSEYLSDILEKLNGLEYYINDYSSTGILYYELLDRYSVKIGSNNYSCLMLNDEPKITQGIVEDIFTEMPTSSVTDYSKADKTDRKINQAYIIVDKQNKTIEAMTKQIKVVEEDLTNSRYTIEQTNNLVQSATEGLKNTLNITGGANLLRNPIGIFGQDYWENEGATPYTDTYIQNKSGQKSCWLLNNGKHTQTIQVKNGTYTFSMLYEKLISVANVILKINDKEYELSAKTNITFEVTDNHITIEFTGDYSMCAYLINLMLNEGDVAQVYSNNANETISDTVMIGKGIQIRATGVNTEFDAQADGIRLKNINTGNTTTEFTDKGTVTNELTTNKATVAKVLITNTGTQTLMTRL